MVFMTNIINDFQSLQEILFFAARCHNLLHKNENQFEIKHFDLDLITKINYNIKLRIIPTTEIRVQNSQIMKDPFVKTTVNTIILVSNEGRSADQKRSKNGSSKKCFWMKHHILN
jgi:hypothetical protein